MFDFIKNMWIMKRYTQEQVQKCVTKGFITEEQSNTILAMSQVTQEAAQ